MNCPRAAALPARAVPAVVRDAHARAGDALTASKLGGLPAALSAWLDDGLMRERLRLTGISGALALPVVYAARHRTPALASLAQLRTGSSLLSYAYYIGLRLPLVAAALTSVRVIVGATSYVAEVVAESRGQSGTEPLLSGIYSFFDRAALWLDAVNLGASLGALCVAATGTGAAAVPFGLALCAVLIVAQNQALARVRSAGVYPSTMYAATALGCAAPALSFALAGGLGAEAAISGAVMVAAVAGLLQGVAVLLGLCRRAVGSSGYAAQHVVHPSELAEQRLVADEHGPATLLGAPVPALMAWREQLLRTEQSDASGLRFYSGLPALTLVGPRGAGLTSTALALANTLDFGVLKVSGAQLHDLDAPGIVDMPYTSLQLLLYEAEERARRVGRPQMLLLEHANLFCAASGSLSTREGLISLNNLTAFAIEQLNSASARHSVVWVLTSEAGAQGCDTLPFLNTHAPVRIAGLTGPERMRVAAHAGRALMRRAQALGCPLPDDFVAQLSRTLGRTLMDSAGLNGRHIKEAISAGEFVLRAGEPVELAEVFGAIRQSLALRPRPQRRAPRKQHDLLTRLVLEHQGHDSDIGGFFAAILQLSVRQQLAPLASPGAALAARVRRKWLEQAAERTSNRFAAGNELVHYNAYNNDFVAASLASFDPEFRRANSREAGARFAARHHAHVLMPAAASTALVAHGLKSGGMLEFAARLRDNFTGRRRAHPLLAEP